MTVTDPPSPEEDEPERIEIAPLALDDAAPVCKRIAPELPEIANPV